MMRATHHIALIALTGLFAFGPAAIAQAEEAAKPKKGEASEPAISPLLTEMQPQTLAKDYCDAFARNAQEARNDRERADLMALQADVNNKLKELSDKTVAIQSWVKQRDDILALATDSVLKIYTTMDPSAAATELSKLDVQTASAILRKLAPKKTSAILVEMDPKHAAELVALMAADSKLLQGDKS